MSSFSLVEVGETFCWETESPEVPRVRGAEGCEGSERRGP